MSNDYKIDATDGTITLTSTTKIILKVGENSLILDNNGLTIKAANIKEAADLQFQLDCVQAKVAATGGYKNSSSLVSFGQ